MYTWPCDHMGCELQSIPLDGHCHFCGKNLCKSHDAPSFHICKTRTKDENYELFTRGFDWDEELMKRLEDCDFESAAKALRPGHECSVKRPKTAQEIFDQAGGTNYHVPIDFDDGVQWLARVRRISNTQPPVINIRRTMDSEIATMQALFSAGIKVPQVYAPKTGDLNSSLHYFFIEKLEGSAHMPWYTIDQDCDRSYYKPMDEEFATHYFNDLADHYIKLSQLTFDSIGMLATREGSDRIGPILPSTRHPVLRMWFPACRTNRERYCAEIDHVLKCIVEKIFTTDPVDTFLIHLAIRDMVQLNFELGLEHQEFYIAHQDASGDNMLLTEAGNISAIIDWQLAIVSTKQEAFAGHFTAAPADIARLSETLIKRGRPDLAECIENGSKYVLLSSCIGNSYDSEDSWSRFQSLTEALTGRCIDYQTKERWCRDARARYSDNEDLKHLTEFYEGKEGL